jgi:hypothetical protein
LLADRTSQLRKDYKEMKERAQRGQLCLGRFTDQHGAGVGDHVEYHQER